jgi:hypothetical protein
MGKWKKGKNNNRATWNEKKENESRNGKQQTPNKQTCACSCTAKRRSAASAVGRCDCQSPR